MVADVAPMVFCGFGDLPSIARGDHDFLGTPRHAKPDAGTAADHQHALVSHVIAERFAPT
jgi:hypothetical protein